MAALRSSFMGPRILAPAQRLPVTSMGQETRSYHGTYRIRPFHESEKQQWRSDTSSIDFAYMPQHTLDEAAPPEVMRIPLLPHNFFPPRAEQGLGEAIDDVIRPEISLVSASSTHIESPSAMSEVTDNHAVDVDPYDLTNKVTAAATKTVEDAMNRRREEGTVRELWSGLLDDLFGSRRMSKA
ncbi:MAG: hypothetical protein LQ344_006623 [Seirophora lacunosa]|nr:MAG: hypothetical protein LQ344_006623 [Seirophora lacunosa]